MLLALSNTHPQTPDTKPQSVKCDRMYPRCWLDCEIINAGIVRRLGTDSSSTTGSYRNEQCVFYLPTAVTAALLPGTNIIVGIHTAGDHACLLYRGYLYEPRSTGNSKGRNAIRFLLLRFDDHLTFRRLARLVSRHECIGTVRSAQGSGWC